MSETIRPAKDRTAPTDNPRGARRQLTEPETATAKRPRNISLRPIPALLAAIDDRLDTDPDLPCYPGRGNVAAECLERYFYLLKRMLPDMRAKFSPEELEDLLDACKDVTFDPWSIPMLWAMTASNPALSSKLKALDTCQCASLADAIEQWKAHVKRGETPAAGDLLK